MTPVLALRSLALTLVVAPALLLTAPVPATAEEEPARYELSVGLGGAKAFEDDLFNVPLDSGAKPELFYDFRFRQNLRGPWALGFQMFGTLEETEPYAVSIGGSPKEVRFDFATVQIGAHARYRLTDSRVRPYFEVGANYVAGAIDQTDLGQLNLNGVSVHGGAGLQFLLSRSVALELGSMFATGIARWERAPFGNSRGSKYDPSLAALSGAFCYRWGR